MGKYKDVIIPVKSQPNIEEKGEILKRKFKCYQCNEFISGHCNVDLVRGKPRYFHMDCVLK